MHPPRVLVVDDELDLCRIYTRFLTNHGYQALSALSAEQARPLIHSFRPDLILLDLALPVVGGFAFFKALRADPATARLPVILMTGLSMPDGMLDAAAKGANADSIIAKPRDLTELLPRIAAALNAGPYRIDSAAEKIWIKGRELPHLTHTHFRLLRALLQTSEPVSADDLLRAIWSNSDSTAVVHVTAGNLRRALAARPDIRLVRLHNRYRAIIA